MRCCDDMIFIMNEGILSYTFKVYKSLDAHNNQHFNHQSDLLTMLCCIDNLSHNINKKVLRSVAHRHAETLTTGAHTCW